MAYRGGGKPGNKNAEKWTEETVMSKLEEIQELVERPDVNYLGTALTKVGLYNDIWRDWSQKFSENLVVSRTMKKIRDRIQSKLYERALNGDVVPSIAIFGLKNNHGWTDRQQLEHTGQQEIKVIKEIINADSNKNTE